MVDLQTVLFCGLLGRSGSFRCTYAEVDALFRVLKPKRTGLSEYFFLLLWKIVRFSGLSGGLPGLKCQTVNRLNHQERMHIDTRFSRILSRRWHGNDRDIHHLYIPLVHLKQPPTNNLDAERKSRDSELFHWYFLGGALSPRRYFSHAALED